MHDRRGVRFLAELSEHGRGQVPVFAAAQVLDGQVGDVALLHRLAEAARHFNAGFLRFPAVEEAQRPQHRVALRERLGFILEHLLGQVPAFAGPDLDVAAQDALVRAHDALVRLLQHAAKEHAVAIRAASAEDEAMEIEAVGRELDVLHAGADLGWGEPGGRLAKVLVAGAGDFQEGVRRHVAIGVVEVLEEVVQVVARVLAVERERSLQIFDDGGRADRRAAIRIELVLEDIAEDQEPLRLILVHRHKARQLDHLLVAEERVILHDLLDAERGGAAHAVGREPGGGDGAEQHELRLPGVLPERGALQVADAARLANGRQRPGR